MRRKTRLATASDVVVVKRKERTGVQYGWTQTEMALNEVMKQAAVVGHCCPLYSATVTSVGSPSELCLSSSMLSSSNTYQTLAKHLHHVDPITPLLPIKQTMTP